ncbi:MAG: Sulfite reductase [NADPH] flavoprotein alpha-component [Candidatus Celerinatantimonas neptuna]|nr:MAG: Sulfite reductase [NADPH] flavoprotein alpha-component [Candidatus Celerinatantimonas neptuna]
MSFKELNELSSPLSKEQLTALERVIGDMTPLQRSWVSGYLAGLNHQSDTNVAQSGLSVSQAVTILYASQTGNAKGVAEKIYQQACEQNIPAVLCNIGDFKLKGLKKETHLVIVASTNGEGEPPDDALEFHDFIASKKAPRLDGLKYAVLSLGDSGYEQFCQCGIDFDLRLSALGGQAILPRVDCDLDYEQPAQAWTQQVLAQLKEQLSAVSELQSQSAQPAVVAHHYDRQNPATAAVLANQKITGRDSAKDIRHIEFDLEQSGLTYQPGDALGVWFKNDLAVVDEILSYLDLEPAAEVIVDEQTVALRDALQNSYELTQTSPVFVSKWAKYSESEALLALDAQKPKLREYAATHQLVDIVREHPSKIPAEEFLKLLRRLTPRMYSIASSQSEVEQEVHLTVAIVRYEQGEAERFGGCSGYLSRLEEGQEVRLFVEANKNFKLPEDPSTPVIMIGPGTGIAPFRAFMQEREAQQAQGDNWLFFGNPHFTQDFLYQIEWQSYVKSGLLTRIDVAFSRDQAHKIYVQDKLREQAVDVYQWLQRGAYVYICGDANRMAKDVHEALVAIVAEQGQMDKKAAESWLKQLRKDKRYQRDVY